LVLFGNNTIKDRPFLCQKRNLETGDYRNFITGDDNRMKNFAFERLIEILGEAANHVSQETQSTMPNIPWSKIIGMRNKLAHDYGEILSDRIWAIAVGSIRELVDNLAIYGVVT